MSLNDQAPKILRGVTLVTSVTYTLPPPPPPEPWIDPYDPAEAAALKGKLFEAWSYENQVMCDYRSRFDALRKAFAKKGITRKEAEKILRQEQYDERYPLLPEWLL